ncbi:MAG: guanylate kinase [Oscillospiraceae bacterium]|jgi:guanylate kinase
MNNGLLVVVSGPSGCGKGTVLGQLLKNDPNVFYSVSATTRSPREGEVDGVNYYFLSKQEFERKIAEDGMLEYANYVGNYYGTPKQAVEEQCAAGHDVLLEIEVQGAMQVREKRPDAVFVFIAPPSMKELERRLVDRQTESEEVIRSRLKTAETELRFASKYDYIVVNDTVEQAVSDLRAILQAEKCRSERMKNRLDEVL